MSDKLKPEEPEPHFLGTLGWVGVVVVLASLALMFLSWVGPLGDQ